MKMEFNMRQNILRLLVLLIFSITLWGCTKEEPVEDVEVLFKKAVRAEITNNFEAAVGFYQTVIDKYPNSPQYDKALFMIGFIKSENLGQKDEALKYFQEILNKYPDSELTDDAEFMIETIESGQDALSRFEEKTGQ